MENIITIDNLSFIYDQNKLFNNFSLNIYQGEWLSIIGPSGSGKSALVKILTGLLKTDNKIIINHIILNENSAKDIRRMMGVVFNNPDNQFVGDTVSDDLAFSLENLNYSYNDISIKISDVSRQLKIEDLLDKKPHQLSGGQKQKVALAAALITDPKIIIFDDALSMIDLKDRKEILDIIKKLNKDYGKTIIYITNDLEETLYSDRILVLNKGVKVIEGLTTDVLKEERILNRLGLELPFMVDLSLKLKFYNLLDDIELDMNEMVVKLWK